MGGARIEIAGRLVGKNNFWIGNERAGDSDTLLLSARKLPGVIILTLFEMEVAKSVGSLDKATSFRKSRID